MSPRKALPVDGLAAATADVIDSLLAKQDMSGAELGRRIGRSQNYVAIRLRKESPFSVSDLADVAGALGVTPSRILQDAQRATIRDPAREA